MLSQYSTGSHKISFYFIYDIKQTSSQQIKSPGTSFSFLVFCTPNSCQCHTQSFLGLLVHISTVYWSGTEGPHCGLGCCQNVLWNLEYLDWFKMHFPSWSFDKPFSEKLGLDIWMSTLIQQHKNRYAYDTDCP